MADRSEQGTSLERWQHRLTLFARTEPARASGHDGGISARALLIPFHRHNRHTPFNGFEHADLGNGVAVRCRDKGRDKSGRLQRWSRGGQWADGAGERDELSRPNRPTRTQLGKFVSQGGDTPCAQRDELPTASRVISLHHTSATLLLLADVPAKVVSECLGHSSSHSHVLPAMQKTDSGRDRLAAERSPQHEESRRKSVQRLPLGL
jgi:hypothetical protein